MEPFEEDELQDGELDALLHKWRAPQAPARLRHAVLAEPPRPWWIRLWTTSIHIPLPAACALSLVLALAVCLWPHPSPAVRTVVKTERVEVPVIQERVVTRTVYRERKAESTQAWRPVAELRPRILRSQNDQN